MPLSFKNNIKNTALGNIALGNIALKKSLINQPLVQYLLNYLLKRSFSFISQSLVKSFSREKAIEYYPTLTLYCPPNLISLMLIYIQTATGTVLPPILTKTWADTPIAPNPNQSPTPYYHLN